MNPSRLLPTLVLLCLLAPLARGGAAERNAEGQVRAFYRSYMHEINADHSPLTTAPASLKRYVSARFLKEIDKATKSDDLDYDPFVCAQDFDKGWEKNIAIKNLKVEGAQATAALTLSGHEMPAHHLRLSLVNEDGAWKIDGVKDLDLR